MTFLMRCNRSPKAPLQGGAPAWRVEAALPSEAVPAWEAALPGRRKSVASFVRERSGIAAVEFAIIASVLSMLILNVADVGRYMYERMQLDSAAHYGAMAALSACDLNHLPATSNCSGLNAAVSAQIANTSLGQTVALVSGSPSEAYYCVSDTNTLQYVGDVSSKPSNCAGAGNPSVSPVDYLNVEVVHTYAPLFAISVGSLFTAQMDQSAQIRMS